MLVVDTHIGHLTQIELLNKKLTESNLGKANVSQVQELRCDFYGKGHENMRFSLEESSEEAKFANFQKNNPHSNTNKPIWKDHPNFRCGNNQNSGATQGIQQSK